MTSTPFNIEWVIQFLIPGNITLSEVRDLADSMSVSALAMLQQVMRSGIREGDRCSLGLNPIEMSLLQVALVCFAVGTNHGKIQLF
jgi:hypothetical protein